MSGPARGHQWKVDIGIASAKVGYTLRDFDSCEVKGAQAIIAQPREAWLVADDA